MASFGLSLLASLLFGSVVVTPAADVTLTASDAGGTTSYNTAGHWSNAAAPAPGNTYDVAGVTLRTPNPTTSGNNYIFLGDSLSLDSGAYLLGKIGNNTGGSTASDTITVTNLILNGGWFHQADVNSDNATLVVAGNVNVVAASIIGAIGGTGNNSGSFDTLDIASTISGSAALLVSGPAINTGQDTGVVRLDAANPYSGTITVSNGNSGVIASAINRALQLNNLNALSNATLNLNSTPASPVSFASGVNTGSFNVGALTGSASQSLADTAGSAVALSVGGNNASTSYAGVLSGPGSLVKMGSGTLTLSGTNLYTGNTTVSNGTLALAVTGSVTNSPVIAVASGATFDVSANVFTLGAAQSLFGNGTVKGSMNTASGSTIYAGGAGTYGTNTFTGNLTLASGALVALDLGAQFNGANDLIIVGGNLVLSSTTILLTAPSPSINLDTTADYTLMTVAGSISGTVAATPTWNVPPQNAANYSVVLSGNSIKLHYTVSAPPTGSGYANPSVVARNQGALITVTVTSSSHPISSVTLDASALGGSSVMPLIAAGGGVYTNTVAAGAGIAPGLVTLVATMVDSTGLSGTTPGFTLTVTTSSETWSGGGANNNWSTNPNWAGGAAPGYVGDTLTFSGTTRLTPFVDANYSVTDVNFDSSAGSFVIGTAGNSITLTGGGIVNNSPNGETVNVPVTTAAPETFDAASGNLTLEAVTNAANLVTVNGSANTTVVGNLSGTGGLEKDDGGTLILAGTNAFTGNMSIDNGTVQITGAGLLGGGNYLGNITNNGAFQYSSSATQTLAGAISSAGGVILDGPGTLTLDGPNTYLGDTTINGGIFQIAASGSLAGSYAGNITDNGILEYSSAAAQTVVGTISGTGSLVKDGAGTLTLDGGNTYSGATTVTAGTLVFDPVSVSYPAISSISISNAAVTANVGAGNQLPVGNLVLNNNSVLNLNFDFSSGNPTVAAVNVATSLTAPGTNLTINVGGVGAVIGQFPLIAYASAPLPSVGNFVLGALPPGITASLVDNVAGQTIDLKVTSELTATWIPLTGTDAFGTSSFNTAGLWSDGTAPGAGNGYYTKNYALRSPADTNAYVFGGLALSVDAGGRFLLKSAGGQVLTVNNLYMNGGVMDFANTIGDNLTETVGGSVILQPALTSYFGALSSETFFVSASISGSGNLQIAGSNVNVGQDTGVVVLTGSSTYTGSTTVAMGTLLVNGSLAGTAVTVNTNTTLGGLGSIAGPITIQPGGKLAPGVPAVGVLTNILGTLTADSPVTVDGSVSMRINRSAASDSLSAPAVRVAPGAALTVSNVGSTNLVAGDTFTLFSAPISAAFTTLSLPPLPGTNVYWTNLLAINGTIAVEPVVTVATNPTNITFSAASGELSLSWPADHTGWTLQSQTNSVAAGLGTNWVNVLGSTGTNAITIPISFTNGAVFYRLKH
jgi:autotransporter-associated beta strand protein